MLCNIMKQELLVWPLSPCGLAFADRVSRSPSGPSNCWIQSLGYNKLDRLGLMQQRIAEAELAEPRGERCGCSTGAESDMAFHLPLWRSC